VIDEAQHDQSLNDPSLEAQKNLENTILKSIVRVEKYYDLQDKLKKILTTKPIVPLCGLKLST
jgi:hypothetical protein